jgi:hypothetical protein
MKSNPFTDMIQERFGIFPEPKQQFVKATCINGLYKTSTLVKLPKQFVKCLVLRKADGREVRKYEL